MDPNIEQFLGAETDVDLLPNYRHHSKKTLMTVDWVRGVSHVGQCFKRGVAAFYLVLSKYVIECGFDFKFVKNSLVRVRAVYTLREKKGCTWLIHRRVQTCNGYFYLKRLSNLHNCGAVVRTGKNSRLNSELVCSVFGVEKARGKVYGDYHVSFDQLRWYADAVMQYNPRSSVNLDFEQSTGRFKRFFISFKSYIDRFNHIRPLLFVDGTFLLAGNLLAVTGKDGNKSLFLLAFAIVDSKTTANWTWVLEHLTNVVNSARTLTFISNRNTGFLESLPTVFPSTHHAYCLQHLQANLWDKLRSKHYKEITSNAAESFNKWILYAYIYPITRLVDTIRNQIMTMRAERKLLATNWNGLPCPKNGKLC
ncbi:uncharacterized protein LOC114305490 [Camellia sinensis]|uniref:uncharacterized protein LOC114305490 n=1 Tax=Camellia sinensis TaxID=4442 RepID=UPI001035F52F|nr:uncharacterized protein LOC114305490 [Camellia sinensis]